MFFRGVLLDTADVLDAIFCQFNGQIKGFPFPLFSV